MTKNTIAEPLNRFNAKNTFSELLKLGAIPIVNENDTVSTFEIEFGDNDTLSAIVAALIDADLLIRIKIRMRNLSVLWIIWTILLWEWEKEQAQVSEPAVWARSFLLPESQPAPVQT